MTYYSLRKIYIFINRNSSNIIALIALYISIVSLNNANKQFEINSQSADSLFNVQINNEKRLNDSLIKQISDLQNITSKQLEFSEKQLNILTSTLDEEKYAGRPKFQIGKTYIQDTVVLDNKIFSPAIMTPYINVGRRFSYKTQFKSFIVYPDFSGIRGGLIPKNIMTLESNASMINRFKPQIPIQFKDDFYYCFEIVYYDKGLNREFKQTEYYHYFKSRGKNEFNSCNDNDEKKIKNVVNAYLRKINEKQIDE